jgi:hypothetical protein
VLEAGSRPWPLVAKRSTQDTASRKPPATSQARVTPQSARAIPQASASRTAPTKARSARAHRVTTMLRRSRRRPNRPKAQHQCALPTNDRRRNRKQGSAGSNDTESARGIRGGCRCQRRLPRSLDERQRQSRAPQSASSTEPAAETADLGTPNGGTSRRYGLRYSRPCRSRRARPCRPRLQALTPPGPAPHGPRRVPCGARP